MTTIKIIGSYRYPLVHSKKIRVSNILAKPIKAILEFLGYYVLLEVHSKGIYKF